MTKRDFYEVLGVSRDADDSTIKKAYRTLAMKYHPDKNPGDAQAVEKMKELNEAYAVLCDSQKRQLYDRYGHAGLEGMTQEDIFRNVDFGSLFSDLGFGGSIFEQFFGARGGARGRQRGSDLRYDLEMTLEEAAQGLEKKLDLNKARTCPECQGTGAGSGGVVTCEKCRGTGQVVVEQRSGYTVMRQISVCSKCRGAGRLVKEQCKKCKGKGQVAEPREITVRIPRGVDSGQSIVLEGEGEPGTGGARPGDLYVVLKIAKHAVFERHGDDLVVEKGISFSEAALGAQVLAPSLDGEVKVHVPAGTQTGAVVRVSGHGMPRPRGFGKGDLYVAFKVVTPTRLSDKARELLKELAELEKPEVDERSGSKGKR